MPADLRQTILGDLRTIINDAWDFFAPPLIKFSIALFFFWYICGSEPFYTVKDGVTNVASSWDSNKVTDFLDKYKLTSLLPIAALFLVAVFTYVVNRIIFGVAELLPINIGYTGDRIERMIQEDPLMQKQLESLPPYSGYMLVDFALAKARSQKEEALLRNVDSLEKASGRKHSLFSFAKFLLFWTVACCVLSLTVSGATVFSYNRVNLLAFTVIVFGVYAASQYARSLEYLGYAKVHIVRLMLMGDDYLAKNKPSFTVVYPEPKDEGHLRHEERQMRIEYLRRQDWWFLSLRLMDWWEVLRYFRHYDRGHIKSDPKLLLRALLRNSANILWFVMGALLIVILARFSWWLGVGLFVGYVTITIVDCLLVAFLLGAITIKLLIATLTTTLSEIIVSFLPEKPQRAIEMEDDQYRITVGAIRLVEAGLAIILCRALGSHFFG